MRSVWKLQKMILRHKLIVGERVTLYVPVRCNGNGKVIIGDGTTIGYPLAPKLGNGEVLIQAREPGAVIKIGRDCAFSNNVAIVATQEITIGDKCLIGDLVLVIDSDFHEIAPNKRHSGPGRSKPVSIGNNVFLGSRVIVKKGVNIGDNSVIGAQSVVSCDVPANCLANGNPATVIKRIDDKG